MFDPFRVTKLETNNFKMTDILIGFSCHVYITYNIIKSLGYFQKKNHTDFRYTNSCQDMYL